MTNSEVERHGFFKAFRTKFDSADYYFIEADFQAKRPEHENHLFQMKKKVISMRNRLQKCAGEPVKDAIVIGFEKTIEFLDLFDDCSERLELLKKFVLKTDFEVESYEKKHDPTRVQTETSTVLWQEIITCQNLAVLYERDFDRHLIVHENNHKPTHSNKRTRSDSSSSTASGRRRSRPTLYS